jgi:hypothetical protein
MADTPDTLAGEELAVLCEALSALIEARRWHVFDNWATLPHDQREQWRVLKALQEKLDKGLGMPYHMRPAAWIEELKRAEREATLRRFHTAVVTLARQPRLTRSELIKECNQLYTDFGKASLS